MQDLTRASLGVFLDQMAATASVPGGGSAAALEGALGAALLGLVCRLTLPHLDDPGPRQMVDRVLAEAEAARQALLQAVDDDARVLDALLGAYRLPRDTEARRARRATALAEGSLAAATVPLEVMRAAARLMDLCAELVEIANRLAVSDVGVAVLAADAALRSAALNVEINLDHLSPEQAHPLRAELDRLQEGRAGQRDEVLGRIRARLAG